MKTISLFLCLTSGLALGQTLCNGEERFCTRRYHEVSFFTTMQSMSSKETRFVPPHQPNSFLKQLDYGVRAFLVEAHLFKQSVYLCQNSCEFGRVSAFEAFYDITQFMHAHPNDVVTIFVDAMVGPNALESVLWESGLLSLAHAQPKNAGWPTLAELNNSGKRLIVFTTEDFGASYPFLHYFANYGWSTSDIDTDAREISCSNVTATIPGSLLLVLHSADHPFVMEKRSERINSNPLFLTSIQRCSSEAHQLPNFVAVDFYTLGDVRAVVQNLNAN